MVHSVHPNSTPDPEYTFDTGPEFNSGSEFVFVFGSEEGKFSDRRTFTHAAAEVLNPEEVEAADGKLLKLKTIEPHTCLVYGERWSLK